MSWERACATPRCAGPNAILNTVNDVMNVRARFSDSACTGLDTKLQSSLSVQGPADIVGVEHEKLDAGASYLIQIRAKNGQVGKIVMSAASGICSLGSRTSSSTTLPDTTYEISVDTVRPSAKVVVTKFVSNQQSPELELRITMPPDVAAPLTNASFAVTNGAVTSIVGETVAKETVYVVEVLPKIAEGNVNITLLENSVTDSAGNGNEGTVRVLRGDLAKEETVASTIPLLHDGVPPEASVSVYGKGYNSDRGFVLFTLFFSEPVIGFSSQSIVVNNGNLTAFVVLDGVNYPENVGTDALELPYILATEVGILVKPRKLEGDLNVTVTVKDGGFQDLAGNAGKDVNPTATVN